MFRVTVAPTAGPADSADIVSVVYRSSRNHQRRLSYGQLCSAFQKSQEAPASSDRIQFSLYRINSEPAALVTTAVHWDEVVRATYLCIRDLYIDQRFRGAGLERVLTEPLAKANHGRELRMLVSCKDIEMLDACSCSQFGEKDYRMLTKSLTTADVHAQKQRVEILNDLQVMRHETFNNESYFTRHARLEDEDAIVKYTRMMGRETLSQDLRLEVVRQGVRRALYPNIDSATVGEYMVTTHKQVVVAIMKVVPQYDPFDGSWIAYLRRAYIHQKHRGKGLLGALIDAALGLVCRLATRELRSFVHRGNASEDYVALHAFESYGFRRDDDVLFVNRR
ncbi:MAG TPA: hypothetical protein VHR66_25195 [Gemmataceae bacterium]|nr:hypothetical protein [Gemmataceae bacterium]